MEKEKSKYKSLAEWKKACINAYAAALRNGYLSDIAEKFSWYFKGKWTKEKCIKEALKFDYKSDWRKKSIRSFNAAKRKGWLNECCKHMILKRKPIGYWTKEKCIKEALNYKTKNEWRKKSHGSYIAAVRHMCLEKCFPSKNINNKIIIYWTKEKCLKESLKYKTKKEWREKNLKSYNAAYCHKWINMCCKHMIELMKPVGYWTKENCIEDALTCNTRNEWCKKSNTAYKKSLKEGWSDECFAHMIQLKKPYSFWTKENCQKEALKYNNRKNFRRKSSGAWAVALKNKWIDEICNHMKKNVQKPQNYWTKEKCFKEAKKYNSRSEFQKKSPGAYSSSVKNLWYEECSNHMKGIKRHSRNYWTKEKCIEEAKKYNSRSEWGKTSGSSCVIAKKNNWFLDCCKHMKK